jgi:hypothetical protein
MAESEHVWHETAADQIVGTCCHECGADFHIDMTSSAPVVSIGDSLHFVSVCRPCADRFPAYREQQERERIAKARENLRKFGHC